LEGKAVGDSVGESVGGGHAHALAKLRW
jgi:hypothetical protein